MTDLATVQLDGALQLQLVSVCRAGHVHLAGDVEVHDHWVGGAQVGAQLDCQPLQQHMLCHRRLHQRHLCLHAVIVQA